jgi:hypothetical protein
MKDFGLRMMKDKLINPWRTVCLECKKVRNAEFACVKIWE